jgi:hypothetical protein
LVGVANGRREEIKGRKLKEGRKMTEGRRM